MYPAFRRWPRHGQHTALAALAMAAAFLLAALGLTTRPADSLAVLWPANAVLAGLLLRYPALSAPQGWAGILFGLTLANLAWNEPLALALAHSLIDLSGLLVAWRILAPFGAPESLRSPRAVARLLLVGVVAAATHAAVSLTLQPPGAQWVLSAANWFLGQLLSYSAFLPPILLLPRRRTADARHKPQRPGRAARQRIAAKWLPIAVLAASFVLCALIGGPGAVIFPAPALLYCALVYRQSTTAWLAAAAAAITTLGIAYGWILVSTQTPLSGSQPWDFASLRLGVLLMVGAPLLVSGILAARSDTIEALRQALDHDALTRTLSRQAFLRDTQEHLQSHPPTPKGSGLLMLDIDDFKRVNDTHGHPAGDRVLREFARIIREAIRPHDLCGRMGGEEFSLLLPDATLPDILEIAERLRVRVGAAEIPHADGDLPLRITVSIGSIHTSQAPYATLTGLLAYADQAMYRAKRMGGNRAHNHDAGIEPSAQASPTPPPSPSTHQEAP
ncbi:diguanylate cyclase [Castellaniella sp. GW247-6E4]|uniref:GGDEF domain-containing protein n=1 Tax=Castellaniella sp. GW247-6E4 TaxID=3140380 RepID=UPI003314BF44